MLRRSALVVAVMLAGCGGSGTTSTHTQAPTQPPPATGRTVVPSETSGNGGAAGPTTPSPPEPSGAATVTVTPQTTSPGGTLTVTLHAPAGTRQARVTLTGIGGTVSAPATPRGGAYVATLVVPRTLKGGMWPVVARYGATTLSRSVFTEVKVFTP